MRSAQKSKKNGWNIIARYLFAFAFLATFGSLPLGHMDFYESPESFKLKITGSILLWLLFVLAGLFAAYREWNQANRRKWLTVVYTLPLLLLAVGAIRICVMFLAIFQEVPFDPESSNRVVKMIETSQLIPNSHGSLTLPAQFHTLSKNGSVYVTHGSSSELLVYFPALDYPFLRGTLYSSCPLVDAASSNNGLSVSIKANALGIQNAPLTIRHKINRHWYSISTE